MLTHIHSHFIYPKISSFRTHPDQRYVDILAIYTTSTARIYFNIGHNRWFYDLTSSHSCLVGSIELSKVVVTHSHVNCIRHRTACKSIRLLSWWRPQMETFSSSLALCEGNPLVMVDSPHKSQWCWDKGQGQVNPCSSQRARPAGSFGAGDLTGSWFSSSGCFPRGLMPGFSPVRGNTLSVVSNFTLYSWADSRDAGDLRHCRALCDVTLMWMSTRQHWLMQCFGTEQATNHYMNNCWHSATLAQSLAWMSSR